MAIFRLFLYPVNGIIPPTPTQMIGLNQVVLDIIKTANGDTLTLIDHGMQLTAAELAAGFPDVTFEPLLSNYWISLPWITGRTANALTLNMNTTAGSGSVFQQFRLRIKRPNSTNK